MLGGILVIEGVTYMATTQQASRSLREFSQQILYKLVIIINCYLIYTNRFLKAELACVRHGKVYSQTKDQKISNITNRKDCGNTVFVTVSGHSSLLISYTEGLGRLK